MRSARPRTAARGLLLAGAILGGCGGETILGAGPGRALDPGQVGPYAVGVTTVHVEDPTRINPRTGGQRSFKVEIWYPAAEDARAQPRDRFDFLAEAPPELRPELADLPEPEIVQDAARDPLPRAGQGRFPLVLFSHGNAGLRTQSFFLTTHLASHGYVVVAPDHAGNTFFEHAGLDGAISDAAAHAALRPQDLSLLLDLLERGELTGGRIEAVVDLDRVGVTGHSFGGLTTLVLVSTSSPLHDPRASVAVPMAAPIGPLGLLGGAPELIDAPTFYLAGVDDATVPYAGDPATCGDAGCVVDGYRAHGRPKGLAGLAGVGHLGFTDFCFPEVLLAAERLDFAPELIEGFRDGCGPAYAPPDRAQAETRYYLTAWLNTYLRDSAETADEHLRPDRAPPSVELHVER